ncbi:DUF4241 domain-containing protein [Streptomyces sp. ISL-36]|uniref:DUF4241 domain-containing protein n=1 Tax=Streptomyces sp. ISL-36 TaxID=2819182 RepID=UPI001BE93431|nr:DUF4241 domain-containing protein [Streptomyces sp. ISL-36]MBT2439921.1 DUF4241 domain-containing protein [Streptomyces sp. ISL-36]
MPMTAPDYARYFAPGTAFSYEDGLTGTISLAEVGELALPTGRVVACDPFVHLGSGGIEPFTTAVAPGRYPVEAAVATLVRPGAETGPHPHTRIAAVRLVLKDTPAVSWELALLPGQDAAELGDDEFFGYGVDAGTGCFCDASAEHAFPGTEDEEGAVWAAMETIGHGPAVFMAQGEDGHNLAGFTSGWGDGCYPTWIGRDEAGEASCFVTDFLIVPADRIEPS